MAGDKKGGVRVAEMRLWLGYPAVLVTGGEFFFIWKRNRTEYTVILILAWYITVGLILWGVSIDRNYHWMVGQVAFFLCNHPSLFPPSTRGKHTHIHILTQTSRSRNPNRKHRDDQLHSRLLPASVHERDHLLCCLSQPQRVYQPGK